MHALKSSSFFRPSSRSSSPAPVTSSPRSDSGVGFDALVSLSKSSSLGPLNRLALTSRKRQSMPSTPTTTSILVQDGSYLEALSLKLSGAVSNALALPAGAPTTGELLYNGKRVLPRGRGSAFGALIVSELEASASNPHLHKAIIRLLHRQLSVLMTNVSTQLLPLIFSPHFTVHPSLNPASAVQLHAVAYATFAAEIVESFDAHGLWKTENYGTGIVADNLRGFREGFESLIARVVNPLIHGVKNEIMPLLEALEHPASNTKQGFSNTKGVHASFHPSIITLQNVIPLCARSLTRYTTPATSTSQTTLAIFLISLVWRSLVSMSHRPSPSGGVQSHVPATPALRKKHTGSGTTPPGTPSRFSIRLPQSRPPSPPAVLTPSAAADARALYDLLQMLPHPAENSRFALARDVVDEAFASLRALCALLDVETTGDYADLDAITADLPTVVALPVLLRIFASRVRDEKGVGTPMSVATLLQSTEDVYRQACLGGFGKAEECGPLVARRVLDALVERQDMKWEALMHWLEGRTSLSD